MSNQATASESLFSQGQVFMDSFQQVFHARGHFRRGHLLIAAPQEGYVHPARGRVEHLLIQAVSLANLTLDAVATHSTLEVAL